MTACLSALIVTLATGPAYGQIEEIIVTTQKREQNVQDVPIAISAFGAEELARGGIEDISRLELVTPGLQFGYSGADARVAIRGVRTENVSNLADPQISFFVDNIYKSRTSQALASFVDVQRVEVQRGPQGTLNGRNTFGGTIAIFSNKPEAEFDAGVDVKVGNYSLFRTEGFINLPFSDTVQFRLAGMIERRDGYIEDFSSGLTFTGQPGTVPSRSGADLGEIDKQYVRGSLLWAPTDELDFLLRVSHFEEGGTAPGIFGYTTLGTLAETSPAAPPARQTDLNGVLVPGNTRRGSGGAAPDRGPYEIARDINPTLDARETAVSLDINWDLGPVLFRSITGYTDWRTQQFEDPDYSPAPHALTIREEPVVETITQEFQLLSNTDGAIEWVAGLFYMDDTTEQDFFFLRFSAVEAQDPDLTVARPLVDPFTLIPFSPFARLAEVKTESIAVFGDINWSITDEFRVFGGIRWTEDDKDFTRFNSAQQDPNNQFNVIRTRIPVLDAQKKFDKTTWRLGLQWDLNEDAMAYGQVSTGFTSGGFNTVSQIPSFEPQEITAYEIGIKSELVENRVRLNGALYYNDMEDMLTQGFEDLGVTVVSFLTNAGEIETTGLELELDATPIDAVRITGSFSWMDAEFQQFIVGNPFVLGGDPNLAGNRVNINGSQVALSPEFKINLAGSYRIETDGWGSVTPFLQFTWSDDYPTNDLNQLPGADSYTKTDFRLFWESPEGNWTGEIYVENLEDEEVLVRTTVGSDDAIFASYLPPRMYGIRVGYRYR